MIKRAPIPLRYNQHLLFREGWGAVTLATAIAAASADHSAIGRAHGEVAAAAGVSRNEASNSGPRAKVREKCPQMRTIQIKYVAPRTRRKCWASFATATRCFVLRLQAKGAGVRFATVHSTHSAHQRENWYSYGLAFSRQGGRFSVQRPSRESGLLDGR